MSRWNRISAKPARALAGAISELANGRYNNAANRAYYAAYQAAIVALLRAGLQSRGGLWGHDEVQARFAGELISRRKLYSGEFRRVLQDLASVRRRGDYGRGVVSAGEAQTAVRDMERFVQRIIGRR